MIIPLLCDHEDEIEIDKDVLFKRCLQLYEFAVHFVDHSDQRVITSSLETLQQILRTPPTLLKLILTSPAGITTSNITQEKVDDKKFAVKDVVSEDSSISSPATAEKDDDEDEDLDSKILDESTPATASLDRGRIKLMDSLDIPTEGTAPAISGESQSQAIKEEPVVEDKDIAPETSNNIPGDQVITELTPNDHIGDVGSFFDKDVPLIFCARKLTAQFLLMNTKGELIPDNAVRVSTKALALGCLTQAVSLAPKIFLLTLHADVVNIL